MKMWLLIVVAVLLFATAAQAEDVNPPYNACSVWLGETVQINGLSYVPVMVENQYLLDIRSCYATGDFFPSMELTGTVQPLSQNPGEQGHLNGNYWTHTETAVQRNWGGDSTTVYGKWKLAIWGAWEFPREGQADCASLPYPNQTTGVLCYLRFTGAGTVRLTRDAMRSGDACDFPGITYYGYNVGGNAVQFPYPEPPPCFDCGGEEEPQLPGAVVSAEGPAPTKAAAKRTTWAKIKSFYR